jgi:hypothetical protein
MPELEPNKKSGGYIVKSGCGNDWNRRPVIADIYIFNRG